MGLAVFLLVISLTLVSAVNTPIKVKTYSNHTVSINVIDPETDESLKHSYGQSDNYGVYSIDFVSEARQFSLVLLVSKDKKFVVSPTEFGNFSTGQALEFKLLPGIAQQIKDDEEPKTTEPDEPENNTEEPKTTNTENDVEPETTTNSSEIPAETGDITGQAIAETDSGGSFFTNKYTIVGYIIVGILAISFVIFIVGKKLAKNRGPKKFTVKKFSDFKEAKKTGK